MTNHNRVFLNAAKLQIKIPYLKIKKLIKKSAKHYTVARISM